MRAYRTIVPEDVTLKVDGPVGLVLVRGFWIPCSIVNYRNGWYCTVFGGRWDAEGEELVAPAEYTVRAEDVLVKVN